MPASDLQHLTDDGAADEMLENTRHFENFYQRFCRASRDWESNSWRVINQSATTFALAQVVKRSAFSPDNLGSIPTFGFFFGWVLLISWVSN